MKVTTASRCKQTGRSSCCGLLSNRDDAIYSRCKAGEVAVSWIGLDGSDCCCVCRCRHWPCVSCFLASSSNLKLLMCVSGFRNTLCRVAFCALASVCQCFTMKHRKYKDPHLLPLAYCHFHGLPLIHCWSWARLIDVVPVFCISYPVEYKCQHVLRLAMNFWLSFVLHITVWSVESARWGVTRDDEWEFTLYIWLLVPPEEL